MSKCIVWRAPSGAVLITLPAPQGRLISRLIIGETEIPVDPVVPAFAALDAAGYKWEDVVSGVLTLTYAETEAEHAQRVRQSDVPAEVSDVTIIESSALPADHANRQRWVIGDGNVTVREKTQQEIDDELQARRASMVVSRFQARAALLAAGLLATVENAVAAYDGEDAALMQLAWAEAMEWNRLSPTVTALAAIVQLTDQQLDALFIAAAQIEA